MLTIQYIAETVAQYKNNNASIMYITFFIIGCLLYVFSMSGCSIHVIFKSVSYNKEDVWVSSFS